MSVFLWGFRILGSARSVRGISTMIQRLIAKKRDHSLEEDHGDLDHLEAEWDR